jgi:hypothetical protein
MRKIIITILTLLATNSYADWDSWTDTNKAMFVASQLAISADWMTTRYGAVHRNELPSNLYESNRFLGPYPSVARVNLYHVAMLVSNYYIADYLPPDERNIYLFVRTVTHAGAAHHNIQGGWQLRF